MSLQRLVLAVLMMFVGCVDVPDPPESETSSQELVQGPPRIVATTINAPVVAGKYALLAGKTYTVTVVVDAGTISYLTRVEPHTYGAGTSVSPSGRDDTIVAYSGKYTYTFSLTANTPGDSYVSFHVRDRGSNNVYNIGPTVGVRTSSMLQGPRIASTTISAPIWGGRYQLFAGQAYPVTVRVAMSNVTYSARVEGNNNHPGLHLSPSFSSYASMPRFGGDQLYTFWITPDAIGQAQVAFRLKDLGTGNEFAHDGGVAVTVHGTAAPRITRVSIAGVNPTRGQYLLTIGQRYDVVVEVAPGTLPYTAAVEVNDELPLVPDSANLHNRRTTPVTLTQPRAFHFTLTPTDAGEYQVGFMMRDCPVHNCTGAAFSWHAGIPVVAHTPISAPGPLYGYVTKVKNGPPLPGARVTLETGAFATADASGRYYFSSVPAGSHTLTVTAPAPGGYSTTIVSHLTVPQAGIRVDVDLEEYFYDLASTGKSYGRYIDYLRGRTLFHVVKVPKTTSHVELRPSPPGGYKNAVELASSLPVPPKVIINGGFFDGGGVDRNNVKCDPGTEAYVPLGYRWPMTGYPNAPCQFGDSTTGTYTFPVLGISGNSTNQIFRIVEKTWGFETASWRPYLPGWPLWDDEAPFGTSDVHYAIQAYARLITDGVEGPWPDVTGLGDIEHFWARTAIGVTSSGDLLMVVADGEGFYNSHGANYFVLTKFLREVLQLPNAMGFDGGGSATIAVRRNDGTWAALNTPTSENLNSVGTEPAPVLDFLMAW